MLHLIDKYFENRGSTAPFEPWAPWTIPPCRTHRLARRHPLCGSKPAP